MPTFAAAIAPRFVREQRSSAVPSVVEAGVIAILKHFEKLYTHMPLFTPYFSLDSSAYRVGNGGRLRCHMGAAGIGIYVMLLSHLRDCRDYRAPLDYDLLAFDLHEDADAVRRVVEEFDLFDIDRASGTFTSSALNAVRALGTSDSPSSGRASTRTGRVRRVRTAAQAYRRSVRRLAADNALPPEADDQAGEEGDDFPAENDFPPAEEEEKTNPDDALPAEIESAPADASENARSPRTEEKRGEQNKIPHTPIVPFPPSGKGTRASHAVAPVVGEEEGASEAEVETAVPTVADTPFTPAEKEPKTSPADSPTAEDLSAHPDTRTPHGKGDTTQATTSADASDTRTPHGETSTAQATTAADAPDASTPHGETATTPTTTSADAPDNETTHGETDTTQATTAAAHPDARIPHGKTDTSQPQTAADAPNARIPRGKTSTAQATISADAPDTRTPHGETDTTQATTSAAHPDTRTPHRKTDTTQITISADAPDTEAPAASTAADASHADDEGGETFVPPTANEVRRFAQSLHHPEFDAEWFVHYYTARHWQRHNGHPVRSWQTTARYWLTHPLEVAQHLLRHRPDPGAAPAGTGAPLGSISPSPAGVVATAGSATPSSPGIGAAPAGTRTSSPASGVPLGGSLSLPAPTPLQQSRLCDLRHMVLQLFADAPSAVSASASTVPDAPTAASTPASSVPTSAPSPRVLSPAEAAHFIEAQTLAANPAEERELHCDELDPKGEESTDAQAIRTAHSEEENHAHEISTTDDEEDDCNGDEFDPNSEESIESQEFPTDPAEKENRACEISTTDDEENELHCDELNPDDKESIDAQAISTAHSEEEAPACKISTADTEEDELHCDELASDAKENMDTQAFRTADNEEEVRACELSTADDEKGDCNSDELDPDAKENMDTQAFPTDPAEEENRAHELSTSDHEEGELNCDERPTDAEEGIEAQEFSTDRSEEKARASEISTADTEEDELHCDKLDPDDEENTDAQAFPTVHTEEDARTCESDAADIGGNMDTQAISTKKERFSTRSPHGPAPPTDDAHNPTAARHSAAAHSTEKHPFTLNLNHDAPPLLPLHPPAPVGLGCTLRVQSAQPPFGRALLGRIDIGRAPCPAGSRPLRPQPAENRRGHPEDRRATPDHAPLGSTHEPKTDDFIDHSVADEPQHRPDEPEHPIDGHPHRDFAEKRCLDVPHDGAQAPKTADFIDNSVAHEPPHRSADGEHPADEHPSRSTDGKHRPNAGEHPADRHNAPADEFDAGQRLLDTAAHRRAVRAELAECCGALRHLGHCCVAF